MKTTKHTNKRKQGPGHRPQSAITIDTEKGKIVVFYYGNKVKVVVNGVVYSKPGDIIEIVRVARVKYTEGHFKEVDERISYGMYISRACAEVAEKYHFSCEGFYRQYRDRHLNEKGKL